MCPNQTLVTHLPATATKSFYKLREVAAILDVTYLYLLKLVHSGAIASVRICPSNKRSTIRIPQSEVLRMLQPYPHPPLRKS